MMEKPKNDNPFFLFSPPIDWCRLLLNAPQKTVALLADERKALARAFHPDSFETEKEKTEANSLFRQFSQAFPATIEEQQAKVWLDEYLEYQFDFGKYRKAVGANRELRQQLNELQNRAARQKAVNDHLAQKLQKLENGNINWSSDYLFPETIKERGGLHPLDIPLLSEPLIIVCLLEKRNRAVLQVEFPQKEPYFLAKWQSVHILLLNNQGQIWSLDGEASTDLHKLRTARKRQQKYFANLQSIMSQFQQSYKRNRRHPVNIGTSGERVFGSVRLQVVQQQRSGFFTFKIRETDGSTYGVLSQISPIILPGYGLISRTMDVMKPTQAKQRTKRQVPPVAINFYCRGLVEEISGISAVLEEISIVCQYLEEKDI
ncbi:MAG: hypothetical protein CEN89_627 [Candidatus Berkelbacteria bacterium Licking1014_7]|uniref:J domain-containing protein n=1 Tax=Candidatus Berkelbacteria bacterium Licking1014_7 TaxID=2017147 RepID=A0A554LI41_9BACT|nr:MAG: hypothetical protein CEN89_627 [Candidatus Berkelbacteria bacterium Licking1014_7]